MSGLTGDAGAIVASTASELAAAVANGDRTAVEITQAHLEQIAATDGELHAFLHVTAEGALASAAEVDASRARGDRLGPLAGVPLALKDVFTTHGVPTTAGSKILEGWLPPYDATVVSRLKAAGVVVLGKTNMDEFAMGSSTENSAYGATHNPWDVTRIPGGSSGGSAAAVAAGQAPLAVGTDTGGSIRQPAAVCGIVGVKPTYGAVSRYGLIAFSSSLDQGGPFARTVLDAALLHEAIAGYDQMDSTSIAGFSAPVVEAAARRDISGVRIGVVRELGGPGYEPEVEARFAESVAILEELGASITEISCPSFDFALSAYYLIAPSECSSNLARFDAMRFGLRVGEDGVDGPAGVEEVMSRTRDAGFGQEVKRRIMIGTYALSSGYYDAYYAQAQKVRTLISRDFAAAYEQVDVLISPTTPTVAFEIGARVNDPMAMYATDLATVPANLAGVPALSLPCGLGAGGLPVGLQIMAPALMDERLYRVAGALEAELDSRRGGPLLSPYLPSATVAA